MHYYSEKIQPYCALINTIKYNMKTKRDPLYVSIPSTRKTFMVANLHSGFRKV